VRQDGHGLPGQAGQLTRDLTDHIASAFADGSGDVRLSPPPGYRPRRDPEFRSGLLVRGSECQQLDQQLIVALAWCPA